MGGNCSQSASHPFVIADIETANSPWNLAENLCEILVQGGPLRLALSTSFIDGTNI
jgi:hypothetical protein